MKTNNTKPNTTSTNTNTGGTTTNTNTGGTNTNTNPGTRSNPHNAFVGTSCEQVHEGLLNRIRSGDPVDALMAYIDQVSFDEGWAYTARETVRLARPPYAQPAPTPQGAPHMGAHQHPIGGYPYEGYPTHPPVDYSRGTPPIGSTHDWVKGLIKEVRKDLSSIMGKGITKSTKAKKGKKGKKAQYEGTSLEVVRGWVRDSDPYVVQEMIAVYTNMLYGFVATDDGSRYHRDRIKSLTKELKIMNKGL